MVIQMTLLESILSLLFLPAIVFVGLGILILFLCYLLRKHPDLPRVQIVIGSALLYYYLCVLFHNIVGIPSLRGFFWLARMEESFFNPIIEFIPFFNEPGLEFTLNVLLFIPLGFLCPLISSAHRRLRKMVLFGFCLSLLIEVSQMFTLHRISDINDLMANTFGALLGYLCFALLAKLRKKRTLPTEKNLSRFLPIFIVILAFVFVFFS